MGNDRSIRWNWEAAIKVSNLSPTERLVLLVIATHLDERGEAFPPLSTIARGSGLGRSTVARVVGALDGTWIEVVRRRVPGRRHHRPNLVVA